MKEKIPPAFGFFLPTRIVFGRGRTAELENLLDPGWDRLLLVTDRGLIKNSGAVAAVRDVLKDRDVTLFDGVEVNPGWPVLEEGRKSARECGARAVIGLGGGSAMDAAKGIAALAVNPGEMREYMGGRALERDPLPVVCIPTTSGTGSEVTPYAVFTDRDKGTKGALSHPGIFARTALVDPELTFSMPPAVTIDTGLDALTHAVEAYLSLDASPWSDELALEAARIVLANLAGAAARKPGPMVHMALAAMSAGAAIAQASTILLHIMAYPLTVFHGVPHGRANAALLPVFFDFMRRQGGAREKMRILDGMFGGPEGAENFVRDLGISTRLSDYGVTEGEIDGYVERVLVKGDVAITPGNVTAASVAALYRKAL